MRVYSRDPLIMLIIISSAINSTYYIMLHIHLLCSITVTALLEFCCNLKQLQPITESVQ